MTHRKRLLVALAVFVLKAPALCGQALGASPPEIQVRAGALIEAGSGRALYGMNAGAELPIASATKIMTALVTLQHARLGETIASPSNELAATDSQIGLQAGERMTVRDLLTAMLLPSADDAAEDLAYNVGGDSVPRFVAMMNAEAARLHLRRTHYSTPIGLDTPGNYSTAADLVALARFVLRTQPVFRRLVGAPRAVIRVGGEDRTVSNLNTLVGRIPWVDGVKTGHTLDAGYVLVGSGRRDGMTLISAVLGATGESSRESDTLALLDWGFRNFSIVAPIARGQVVVRRPVRGRHGLEVQLLAAGGFRRVLPRSTTVTTVVHVPRELTGPRKRGAAAGSVVVLAGGIPLATITLRLARAVPAPPSSLPVLGIVGPFTLLVVVLLLGAGIVRARRGRPDASRAAGHRKHDHHRHAQPSARQDA